MTVQDLYSETYAFDGFSRPTSVTRWILGYFIPAQINADMRDFFNRAYGSDIGKWQRDALVHEFMHIWTNKNDMDMAKLWKDQGADLGDISTREKASGEIALFMSRDCKKKK